ncbi:MAG: hypothetical protein ACREPX_07745 [Rhodanobacteraceae bacterium]
MDRRTPYRWLIFAAILVCPTVRGQVFLLNEEESRFLPGLYYFHKGCEYYKHGETGAAIDSWEIAASWAMKDAQYDLGIVHFLGDGVAVDRPRGLAWLALAAERKDEAYEVGLAAAWNESTQEEQARANELWRELRLKYGDSVALPRAQNRYTQEVNHITGSQVGMNSNVRVWTRAGGTVEVTAYKAQLQELADRNFGNLPEGTVDIGKLVPVIDDTQ